MSRIHAKAWMGTGFLALFFIASLTGCPSNDATLRVLNNTSKDIVAVYCTPTSSDSWGSNLIEGTLAAGQTLDIPGFAPDQYDILAVFADESEARRTNVTFNAGETFEWNVLLSLPSGKLDEADAGSGL